MFETLGGLPAHPLLVHIPVVLIPLAAIATVVMALRPKVLHTFGPTVAVLAGVGFVGALLAANAGESLEDSRRAAGETISAALHDHAEQGDTVQVIAGIFFVLVLAWVLFNRWSTKVGAERATAAVRKPKVVGIVLAVLVVLAGVGASYSVTVTGHSGAKSVWEESAP
jgi:uncharacterized membrane protein